MRIFENLVKCEDCTNNINNKCFLYPGKDVKEKDTGCYVGIDKYNKQKIIGVLLVKENIEENLKIVEKLIKTMEQDRITFKDEQSKEIYAYFINALANILSDYKRLQEEFKQVDNECFRLEQKELRLEKEIEELKSDNLEYQRTQDIFDERKYRKKYLEERRAEAKTLLYPDADEIYERYYKLKAENEELKENYKILQECYWNECVSKQKIKDKIEELESELKFEITEREAKLQINLLKSLLEEG